MAGEILSSEQRIANRRAAAELIGENCPQLTLTDANEATEILANLYDLADRMAGSVAFNGLSAVINFASDDGEIVHETSLFHKD